MNKFLAGLLSLACLGVLELSSCKSVKKIDTSNILTDSASIASGQNIFTMQCSPCHTFKQDGIGPQLGGLTLEKDGDWIKQFIHNPAQLIASGDPEAKLLLTKYRVMMPAFTTFSPDELDDLLAYMNIHPKPVFVDSSGIKPIDNPIPDTIPFSGLIADLEFIAQFPATSDTGKLPLTRITKLDYESRSATNYVLDLRGKLYKMQGSEPVLYMDMIKWRPNFIHQPGLATGFGSFAFHPEFAQNGLLYTTHTEPPKTAKADFEFEDSIRVLLQWIVMEWKVDRPGSPSFSGKGRELMRVNVESGIHGMQEITFNPTARPGDEDYGLLYIGIGDGGAVEHGFPFVAHSLNRIWGTVIRIDPAGKNSRNGQYGIPASNPFVHNADSSTVKEIYAYGFRNPHRITWSQSGQMLVSNVGHFNIESLNLILPGHDYGWPIREGTFLVNAYANLKIVYPLPPDDSVYKVTYPVAQYDHGEGNAISGGYEYQGSAVPEFKGKFLFGDILIGKLFYVDMADIQLGKQAPIKRWRVRLNGEVKTLRELCGTDRIDLHFGRDARGELYIMTKGDGKLYKLKGATEQ